MTTPSIPTATTELSAKNHARYTKIIKEVNDGLRDIKNKSFEIASNVYVLDKERLWEGAGFGSIIDCIKFECKVEKSSAYDFLTAGQFLDEEKNSSTAGKLNSLRQLLEFAKIPKESRKTVIEVVESKGKITPKNIKEVFKKLFPVAPAVEPEESEEEVRVDKEGYPLPKSIIEDWDKATLEAKTILGKMMEVRKMLEAGVENKSLYYSELYDTNVADLKNDHHALKRLIPHAVCTCEGVKRESCKVCSGRGFISERLWGAVSQQAKDYRANKSK